jgi:hypothetical protein
MVMMVASAAAFLTMHMVVIMMMMAYAAAALFLMMAVFFHFFHQILCHGIRFFYNLKKLFSAQFITRSRYHRRLWIQLPNDLECLFHLVGRSNIGTA